MSRNREFWDREYLTGEHLALSTEVSEDLEKFTRFLERHFGREFLNPHASVLDLGCGNGRNLVYLAKTYGMRGLGYDISSEALQQARRLSESFHISYSERPIEGVLDVPNASVMLVLDMMTSHFLKKAAREALREEIHRVLRPGGWLFFKSFLADEDIHTRRLLREHPADESGAYIHPELGVYEYAWTEDAVHDFFREGWVLHKFNKSHRHILRGGKAGKRRTFSVYVQKS